MPTFVCIARSKKGDRIEQAIEAGDKRAALLQIERLGLIPVSVVEKSAAQAKSAVKKPMIVWSGRGAKMGTRDILIFTTELSDLLASGMTLGNALNCLANRSGSKGGEKIIADLRDRIIQGSSLSEAAAQHPKTFSKLYVSMIKAGEASGALDEVLKRLVAHYERVQETKEKVVMALVYPMIVLVIGGATLIFAMLYVIPKFEKVFKQMNQALPLPTRILIESSTWFVKYGWVVLAVVVFLVFMAKRAINTKQGRLWWDGLQLRMPLVRGVVAAGVFANFARTLSTLLTNGVPILQALSIVEQTVGNTVIGGELRNARERVTDGTTISKPLAAGKVFPPLMIDMIAVGEQTGDMSTALNHIASRFENELNRNLKIFTTALEPILIVLVALVVGFVAISILMAVFRLTSGLGA